MCSFGHAVACWSSGFGSSLGYERLCCLNRKLYYRDLKTKRTLCFSKLGLVLSVFSKKLVKKLKVVL